jgi:hypothetical protein
MEYFEYSLIYGLNNGQGPERDFLKRWGEEGWELVCITPAGYRKYPLDPPSADNPPHVFYYFKRPLERRGFVGRLADALSATLVWGRARSSAPLPETLPGQDLSRVASHHVAQSDAPRPIGRGA